MTLWCVLLQRVYCNKISDVGQLKRLLSLLQGHDWPFERSWARKKCKCVVESSALYLPL